MNKRINELLVESNNALTRNGKIYPHIGSRTFEDWEKFAELIVRECAKELREAEQEADRAYKAKEVKERNTFDGYDFADMLEERFGVEE